MFLSCVIPYYMKVYSFVMTLAKSKALSEEITQEVFFRAITTKKTFRGESDTFTRLCAIAKNLFYDEMRKRSRQSKEVAVDLSNTGDDPAVAVADADASFRIPLVLHELEEPYKEVFALKKDGSTYVCGSGSADIDIDTTSGDVPIRQK